MFEQTLSPETAKRGAAKRSRFFPAALAVHGVLLLVVLGASLWFVEEPPDPPVPITWVSTAPPAPVQSVRSAGPPRSPAGFTRRRRDVVAPSIVPDQLPGAAAAPEPAAAEVEEAPREGLEPADGEGSGAGGPGVPGGSGPGEDGPGAATRDGILVPGGDVHAPVLVRRVEPVYPEPARKARLEGEVILEAIIAAGGEIEEVRVAKSAGVLLDASAKDAVERWKYRPATLNGRAVRVLLTVTIRFRLH